jgi:hypothetical protein
MAHPHERLSQTNNAIHFNGRWNNIAYRCLRDFQLFHFFPTQRSRTTQIRKASRRGQKIFN